MTVKLNGLPVVVDGVPVIAPVPVLRLRPVGRVPVETPKVIAPVPPVSLMDWLYAWPTVQFGSDAVVMLGTALMVTL